MEPSDVLKIFSPIDILDTLRGFDDWFLKLRIEFLSNWRSFRGEWPSLSSLEPLKEKRDETSLKVLGSAVCCWNNLSGNSNGSKRAWYFLFEIWFLNCYGEIMPKSGTLSENVKSLWLFDLWIKTGLQKTCSYSIKFGYDLILAIGKSYSKWFDSSGLEMSSIG
jgi:hypothetical protein